MSAIVVTGLGAVSPAGWGVPALRGIVHSSQPLPAGTLPGSPGGSPLVVRTVPPPDPRPACLQHPRLRRASPISQYAMAASMESLGGAGEQRLRSFQDGSERLGIIFCTLAGGLQYTRRFFEEVTRNPATASPILFPETVFNAPASHIAACLEIRGLNYSLVADPAGYLAGLALGADWLQDDLVDACLVVGADELDWPIGRAYAMFQPKIVLSQGAGALLLERNQGGEQAVRLERITDAFQFEHARVDSRDRAAAAMRAQLPRAEPGTVLVDGLAGCPAQDRAEIRAWDDWDGSRLSVKLQLGEGMMAAAAWQCVAAVDALLAGRWRAANVSVVGCNHQALGAQFTTSV